MKPESTEETASTAPAEAPDQTPSPTPTAPTAPEEERPAYQQRVIEEKDALTEKLTALSAFIETSDIYQTLPPAEQDRLTRQQLYMKAYSDILQERIAAF